MRQKLRSTFVLVNHTEILEALIGLKDVQVLVYERRCPEVTLVIFEWWWWKLLQLRKHLT